MYDDVYGVPDAQRKTTTKKGPLTVEIDGWVKQVQDGVEKIIQSDRVLSRKSQDDLRYCAQLLSEDAAPFQWDIAMYNKQRPMRMARQIICEDENADLQDLLEGEIAAAPELHIGHLYLIRLDHPPFWNFGRYVNCMNACPVKRCL